jgi:hypothetical protein
VWFLLLAFASHKWVIGACLGLNWARCVTAHAQYTLEQTGEYQAVFDREKNFSKTILAKKKLFLNFAPIL